MDADLQRQQCERTIQAGAVDFTGMYMTVDRLETLARAKAGVFDEKTVSLLASLLEDRHIARNRQSLFLFRKAADTLSALVTDTPAGGLSECAFQALRRALRMPRGPARRAVAEALGGLPTTVKGPEVPAPPFGEIPAADPAALFDKWGLRPTAAPAPMGRSLVSPLPGGDLLVLKLARAGERPEDLAREPLWMDLLRSQPLPTSQRFDVPRPLYLDGSPLFRVAPDPAKESGAKDTGGGRPAVAFVAPSDYFRYPNDPRPEQRPPWGENLEMLCRSAELLGMLASRGIIHTAPIPLFHNRMQQDRRSDGGRYDWTLGGRLDRWISSCAFPNIGPTGIRDFEHFTSVHGHSRTLYRPVGDHLLSLLLIAGSTFRALDPSRMGLDEEGRPADVRDLFDPERLGLAVEGLFRHYFQGFTGSPLSGAPPFDAARLTDRMIEEMGVDRHMDEVLRIADQNEMDDKDFRRFLERARIAGREGPRPS